MMIRFPEEEEVKNVSSKTQSQQNTKHEKCRTQPFLFFLFSSSSVIAWTEHFGKELYVEYIEAGSKNEEGSKVVTDVTGHYEDQLGMMRQLWELSYDVDGLRLWSSLQGSLAASISSLS
uniref:Tudor domain-containing protein n=1 Tax=Steinernema glaseri TaxID=37863 RepID=A0A1I7Y7J0_9BILA